MATTGAEGEGKHQTLILWSSAHQRDTYKTRSDKIRKQWGNKQKLQSESGLALGLRGAI